MKLRKAHPSDILETFRWRNDQSAIVMFSNRKKVLWVDHKNWYLSVLSNPNIVLLFGVYQQKNIGLVRFDITDKSAEISINTNPKMRRRGLGQKLLICACKHFSKKSSVKFLHAKVKVGNIASNKCFKYAGFNKIKTQNGYHYYEKALST